MSFIELKDGDSFLLEQVQIVHSRVPELDDDKRKF